jgi:hypothetical protein
VLSRSLTDRFSSNHFITIFARVDILVERRSIFAVSPAIRFDPTLRVWTLESIPLS